jgi:hypothetical protein
MAPLSGTAIDGPTAPRCEAGAPPAFRAHASDFSPWELRRPRAHASLALPIFQPRTEKRKMFQREDRLLPKSCRAKRRAERLF